MSSAFHVSPISGVFSIVLEILPVKSQGIRSFGQTVFDIASMLLE
jgi:hypothetical protein